MIKRHTHINLGIPYILMYLNVCIWYNVKYLDSNAQHCGRDINGYKGEFQCILELQQILVFEVWQEFVVEQNEYRLNRNWKYIYTLWFK